MKQIALVVLIISTNLVAHNNTPLLSPPREIYIGTENFIEDIPTFVLEAISPVWVNESPLEDPFLLSSGGYNYSIYTPSMNNQQMSSWWGFDFCNSGEDFAYGLYKLYTVDSPNNYILLDYRDDNFCDYDPFSVGSESAQDIWIKYVMNDQQTVATYFWSTSANNPNWHAGNLEIWSAKNQPDPSRDEFEPYAPENLTVWLENGKPRLNWQHRSPTEVVKNALITFTNEIDTTTRYR